MSRFQLLPPGEMRPTLLVDVVERVEPETTRALRDAMLRTGCADALAIDRSHVHILHDSYGSMSDDAIVEEAQIETERLLGAISSSWPLARRVEVWLERLSARWDETLPRESWIAPLLTDVVPAVSGAVVRPEPAS